MKEIETILLPMLQMLDDLKPLSIDLKNQLIKSFQGAAVKKGNLILHEGDVCKTLWFLSEGLLRSYHNIGDKEITSRIMFTSHIVISAGSFLRKRRQRNQSKHFQIQYWQRFHSMTCR